MPNPARHRTCPPKHQEVRRRIALILADLVLSPVAAHVDTRSIEDGTRKRLAHGLLPWADKIIEEVEKGDG